MCCKEGRHVPRENMPITPEVLQWARERAPFTIEEIRTKFPSIEDWEQGTSAPTYPQLEKLSDTLKVPIAVFFFSEPPDVPPIRESFRTLPDANFAALPRAMHVMLRKAKTLQINLAELNEGHNPAERYILRDIRFTPNMDVPEMARRLREYLGISMETQVSWSDSDVAFEAWRTVLEQHGIAVFKDAFRENLYSGFCLYDENFPLIYINNSAKTRQTFTLFHELAHLLFNISWIDTHSEETERELQPFDRHIEATCNRFAAEFLLPNERFQSEIRDFSATEETAVILARRYHISRESVFRRFLEQGYIAEEQYRQAAHRWANQLQTGGGGNPYWTKISYLGVSYINLAFSRYYQNQITEPQLADYLDTKVKNLSKLEDYFGRKTV